MLSYKLSNLHIHICMHTKDTAVYDDFLLVFVLEKSVVPL